MFHVEHSWWGLTWPRWGSRWSTSTWPTPRSSGSRSSPPLEMVMWVTTTISLHPPPLKLITDHWSVETNKMLQHQSSSSEDIVDLPREFPAHVSTFSIFYFPIFLKLFTVLHLPPPPWRLFSGAKFEYLAVVHHINCLSHISSTVKT